MPHLQASPTAALQLADHGATGADDGRDVLGRHDDGAHGGPALPGGLWEGGGTRVCRGDVAQRRVTHEMAVC